MSTYGKANWSRLAIKKENLEDVEKSITDFKNWFQASALWANINIIGDPSVDGVTLGINPVDRARLDILPESMDFDYVELMREINELDDKNDFFDTGILGTYDFSNHFSNSLDNYLLDEEKKIYGFWFVIRKSINLEDLESQKEHEASRLYKKPFRLLDGESKKDVLANINIESWADRKQVLVLFELIDGKMFVAGANKKILEYLSWFMNAYFSTTILPTILYVPDNGELPWTTELFTKIMDANIIGLDMDEVLDNIDNESKIEDLKKTNSIIQNILRKKTLFCEYSDDYSVIQLHTPSEFSGHNSFIAAGDNMSAWTIHKNLNWKPASALLVSKLENGLTRWKIDLAPNMNVTHTYKGLELGKQFLKENVEESLMKSGGYIKLVSGYFESLINFEQTFISLVTRVLEIDPNDGVVGIRILEPFETGEDSAVEIG